MNQDNTGGVRCHDADACAIGAVKVLIDFDQIGTAGPFPVVDGRVRLPAVTMMDLARMLKPTIDAMAAAPQAVQGAVPTDDELTMAWIAAGGVFFGPNTPTGSMPEAKLFPFLRRLSAPAHPAEGVPAQTEPFMWAIQEPGGSAYMDENCVSTSRGIVEAEVDGLNLGLGADDEPYKVVPVYLAATQPAAQGMDADGMYYLQDARHHAMVGNCPSFWRPDGNGYTTNLDEAARFTFEDAMQQHQRRKTDLPWLCSEVDKLRRPTVDCQDMPRSWDAQRAALAAQAKQGG